MSQVEKHGTGLDSSAILAHSKDLSIEFYLSDQSWHFVRIIATENRVWKIRVWIERNAYDFQSSLTGDIWSRDSMEWNTVIRRPLKGAHCESASYVDENQSAAPFRNDSDLIIKQVLEVIA